MNPYARSTGHRLASQLASAVRIGRARRIAALAVCLLLLSLASAGCATLAAEEQTTSDLQNAGFQNVGINVTNGSFVTVSFSGGPSGNDQADAQHAEKIVWDTYNGSFSELAIVKVSGGCTGPVCSSQSSELADETYSQLAAMFGPRPHSLKTTSSSGSVHIWVVIVCIGVVIAGAATAIVLPLTIGRRRRQRRRQAQPPWMARPGWQPGHAGPPPPYWPGGPPPPGWPAGPPQPPPAGWPAGPPQPPPAAAPPQHRWGAPPSQPPAPARAPQDPPGSAPQQPPAPAQAPQDPPGAAPQQPPAPAQAPQESAASPPQPPE